MDAINIVVYVERDGEKYIDMYVHKQGMKWTENEYIKELGEPLERIVLDDILKLVYKDRNILIVRSG